MAIVRGIIREVGKSTTTRVSSRKWYGKTRLVVQDEETQHTYDVHVSANVMDKCAFLPRVGIPVVINGYVDESEYGMSDFVVTRVVSIKRKDQGLLKIHRFDDEE
ncbi:MAG: hypothetical protein P1Q69_09925 [Candidatus Thorarchaeota archaeon]|nr:hypothetical protein [Candidatus Thorarchaeota archaeon]